MKKETTAQRLKQIMTQRNLRQVDILNLTIPYCIKYDVKMNKSDISQYCSGKTEPNQDKLFVLGSALNVSEAWLMGYDVPMEREVKAKPSNNVNTIAAHFDGDEYTEEELEEIKQFAEFVKSKRNSDK